jgi:hypothetical protein
MAEKSVEEIVEEAKKPGTFSILDVLEDRAYPRDEVTIYLNEQLAYDAAQIQESIDELSKSKSLEVQDEIDELIKKREELVEKLESEKYVFTIVGISEGLREDLMNEAAEDFPIEYDEHKNPLTGEKTREEKQNPERDRLFTNLLWFNQIEKIENSNGDIQSKITLKDVEALRRQLPIAGIGAITQSIEKLRVSTAVFMMTVNEDFLAKS